MRHRTGLIGLAPALVVIAALVRVDAVAAQGADDDSTLASVLAGYMDPDRDRAAAPGHGAALGLAWRLRPRLAVEVEGSAFNLETHSAGTDFYRLALGANLIATLRPTGATPYVLATVGAVHNDVAPDSEDSTDPYLGAGLGVLSGGFGSYGVRVRLEARYVRDFFGGHKDDLHGYLGVSIPLRKIRVVEVPRTETTEVSPPHAPVQAEVAPPPPPLDSDQDGVPDPADRCPGTLLGAPVDEVGCVRARAVIALGGVEFETGSADLTFSSRATLEAAVATLRGQPGIRAEVAGHTDNVGREAANLDLSRRRASSVFDYLVAAGISADRLMPVGYGESMPVDTNESAEGRTHNRRVELRVLSR